jgi:hypothetical protein
MLKRVLYGDGLRRPVRDHRTFVNGTGKFVQAHTAASELLFKLLTSEFGSASTTSGILWLLRQ